MHLQPIRGKVGFGRIGKIVVLIALDCHPDKRGGTCLSRTLTPGSFWGAQRPKKVDFLVVCKCCDHKKHDKHADQRDPRMWTGEAEKGHSRAHDTRAPSDILIAEVAPVLTGRLPPGAFLVKPTRESADFCVIQNQNGYRNGAIPHPTAEAAGRGGRDTAVPGDPCTINRGTAREGAHPRNRTATPGATLGAQPDRVCLFWAHSNPQSRHSSTTDFEKLRATTAAVWRTNTRTSTQQLRRVHAQSSNVVTRVW